MALLPKVKLKAIVSFPANILDGVGVDVVKQNGSYQFNLALNDFAPPVAAIPAGTFNALLWDSVSGRYILVPPSLLAGVAIPDDATSDGFSYGRLNATWQRVVPLAGGAMTGPLALNADPVSTMQAATKQYVDVHSVGSTNANVLINGDFRINQVVYVSGAALAAGLYGHDQWKAGASGGDYSFTQLKSSTQITIAAGKSLIQPIENVNVAGGSYVLSWIGTAQARAGVNTLTPSGAYAASPLLISGQTAGTVMSVEFNAGTLGTVKLETGNVVTPFVMRLYDQELLACMRYWQKSYNYADAPGKASTTTGVLSGVAISTTSVFLPAAFKVRMRAIPTTVTLYATSGTQGVWSTSGGVDTVAANVGGSGLGENGFHSVNTSGLTVGSGYIGHYTADARL